MREKSFLKNLPNLNSVEGGVLDSLVNMLEETIKDDLPGMTRAQIRSSTIDLYDRGLLRLVSDGEDHVWWELNWEGEWVPISPKKGI